MTTEAQKYETRYPHYLPWSNRLWVLKAGYRLQIQGRPYLVKHAQPSPIPGNAPILILCPEVPPTEESLTP